MRRRRRRVREVPFSFDSFLDVVANVCGIIIRLILVAWVGARSYPSIQKLVASGSSAVAETAVTESISVPPELREEHTRHRRELEAAQALLIEQLKLLDLAKNDASPLEDRLAELTTQQDHLKETLSRIQVNTLHDDDKLGGGALSIEDLRNRREKLLNDLQALEQSPREHTRLKYRTPVSQPVQAEQFMFECRDGRVAFIDLPALEAAVRHELPGKGERLKVRWTIDDLTPSVGAFRLRYTVAREAGFADTMAAGDGPSHQSGYRYGLAGWIVEPISPTRGEDLASALASGSEFRRITDALDARQAVVTFWVYPDSFSLFRTLRDHLYERELVVAGRPLPAGAPIAGSREGTVSRGQ